MSSKSHPVWFWAVALAVIVAMIIFFPRIAFVVEVMALNLRVFFGVILIVGLGGILVWFLRQDSSGRPPSA